MEKTQMDLFVAIKKTKILFSTLTGVLLCTSLAFADPAAQSIPANKKTFERIASFPVFLNNDIDDEAAAEIVATNRNGTMLVYTDSQRENLGFVNISNPYKPLAMGTVDTHGEPTAVAIAGHYALVGVNTSPSFISPSGKLLVIDIKKQTVADTFDLGGQPDSVAVSPDGRYAAIVIENERDEDLGDGAPPQAPGGFLLIVDIKGEPSKWTLRQVDFSGVADLFPNDPEPEYVDINNKNIAVVTLQENNHLILVNLVNGRILNDFSAGQVNLQQIDINENDLIELNGQLTALPREPDGVSWLSNYLFATADEGDLNGGSRGFTIYSRKGNIKFTSGNNNDHLTVRLGHYPENRSENKGNEPENVEFGVYGGKELLFVGSERSSLVFVYQLQRRYKRLWPKLIQVLPAGVAPEGLLAIPQRDLFIAASEEDNRDDKIRSVLNIYKRKKQQSPGYPTIISKNRPDLTPIPWGALSGLSADHRRSHILYTVHDSFYRKSRIFRLNIRRQPAVINGEIILNDSMGLLAAVDPDLVNADSTVNLDLEGISTRKGGGFWLVSEGAGTVGSSSRPFESLNLLLRVTKTGLIDQVITLPASTNERQLRFGLEGIVSVGKGKHETLYVAFQREWQDDPEGYVRIGRYRPTNNEWTFFYYPLDAALSDNGGWVGLSEITAVGDQRFAVVERDNQAGPDAAIKRIYAFSVAGLTPLPDPAPGKTPAFPLLNKTLVRDLIPDLKKPGGLVLEKIEGMAVLANGATVIVNDNDGVDDSNGETQLIRLNGLSY